MSMEHKRSASPPLHSSAPCHAFALASFIFTDTATTEIYTLSLHDALPISTGSSASWRSIACRETAPPRAIRARSEEHTSELQSRLHLVCRLLLEKNNISPRGSCRHR